MIRILKRLTLVEMVVILSIIALSIAFVIPIVSPGPCSTPERVKALRRLDEIAYRMRQFYSHESKYSDPESWKDQMDFYLLKSDSIDLRVDGWKNEIAYVQDDQGQHFVYPSAPTVLMSPCAVTM